MTFGSQFGQDRHVVEKLYRGRRGGVFVDIGAFDGVTYSNTVVLERTLGWTGLCVEPVPEAFARLRAARACACANVAAAAADGEAEMDVPDGLLAMLGSVRAGCDPRHAARAAREAAADGVAVRRIRVPTRAVTALLLEHGLARVDYLSLDVESQELVVLRALDFVAIDVRALTVENDYHGAAVGAILRPAGFRLEAQIGCDELWVR